MLAPPIIVAAWIYGGSRPAVSVALGMALAAANLWLAARVIGGVADNSPALLLAAALLAFVGGLAALTLAAFALRSTGGASLEVMGGTLIATHLVLVLWEAARAYPVAERTTTRARS